MAEESQEKKKSGPVKRIFKWIGLGLLVLLLIAGIVFQAPLKVITLLVVIFAACTVLPKPFRKWFWLSAGVVVIALIIWVFLPEDDEGWRPYTFDEELAAIEAKYAIPDSENAAIIYNTLLENYDPNAFYVNLPDDERPKIPMREPWLSKDHPQIAEWLQQHQTTITILTKASKFEKCHFPISVDTGPNNKWMKRLSVTRRWAYLLISATNNDIAENRIDEALKKYIATLQIGKHQCQQPAMLDSMVGIAIKSLAINQIQRFVITSDATAEHLRIIEKSLAKVRYDWNFDFTKILESEKLFSKRLLGWFYEINPKGKIRLNRNPWAEWINSWKEHYEEKRAEQKLRRFLELYGYLTYWQKKIIRVQTLLRWFILPSNPKKAGKVIDNIFEKYYAMAKPDFDWKKQPKQTPLTVTTSVSVWPNLNQRRTIERLAHMSRKTYQYHNLHDKYHLRQVSNLKGCQISIALRRYKNMNGRWPQTLDAIRSSLSEEILTDPLNGGSFVYKLSDDGFRLYSKGRNNIDDGGKSDKRGEPKTGADDWLMWPPKSHKTNEENTNAEQQ